MLKSFMLFSVAVISSQGSAATVHAGTHFHLPKVIIHNGKLLSKVKREPTTANNGKHTPKLSFRFV